MRICPLSTMEQSVLEHVLPNLIESWTGERPRLGFPDSTRLLLSFAAGKLNSVPRAVQEEGSCTSSLLQISLIQPVSSSHPPGDQLGSCSQASLPRDTIQVVGYVLLRCIRPLSV